MMPTTGTITGDTKSSRVSAPAQPVALPDPSHTAIASAQPAASRNFASSTRDVAFALQLTWQPTGSRAAMPVPQRSGSNAVPATAPNPANEVERPVPVFAQRANPSLDTRPSPPDASPVFSESGEGTNLGGAGNGHFDAATGIRPQNRDMDAGSPVQHGAPATDQLSLTDSISSTSPSLVSSVSSPIQGEKTLSQAVNKGPGQIWDFASPRPTDTSEKMLPSDFQSPTIPSDSKAPAPGQSPKTESGARMAATQSAATSAVRQESSQHNSGNQAGGNSNNSDLEDKTERIQVPEKPALGQSGHDHAAGSGEGVLFGRPVEPSTAPQVGTKSEPHDPTPALSSSQPHELANTVQPHAIREISLRLEGSASDRVDVQIAQRAGKLQVAVRTPDQDLSKSLQSNLGELIGRLEQKGFRTEAWTPATAAHGIASVKESWNSGTGQNPSGDPGSSGGGQDRQPSQQQSNQRQQGRWKAQLEETLSTPNALSYEEEQS